METTVSAPRRMGLLFIDILGTGLLALGLKARFAPDVAAGIGLPVRWSWPLIIAGAIAMSWAMLLFIRQARAARTP